MNIDELDFKKGDGLIPAIIQDTHTNQVLMLGYMNREALQKTIDTKMVTFYSRSKERLWTKGETSGNTLHLVSIQQDCDADTLLVMADPEGPTCHTGATSCFYELPFQTNPDYPDYSFLHELEQLLIDRKKTLPENSYTSSMFKKGLNRIAQKVGEEGVETVIAAIADSEKAFIYESSDLVFHLLLLLAEKDVPFESLVKELQRRHK